jgi:hypothetical protein
MVLVLRKSFNRRERKVEISARNAKKNTPLAFGISPKGEKFRS